jgi:hypothetical protein
MNKLTLPGLIAAMSLPLLAQQPQIPTLQVGNLTTAMTVVSSGAPLVHIPSRALGALTGNFNVRVSASCDANGFPIGALALSGISMSDSAPGLSAITSVRLDQITSTGHDSPTAYMSGQCMAQIASAAGTVMTEPCRFWALFATGGPNALAPSLGPDIVSFLVFDKTGKRIAYGTGPVVSGSGTIQVSPTSY